MSDPNTWFTEEEIQAQMEDLWAELEARENQLDTDIDFDVPDAESDNLLDDWE